MMDKPQILRRDFALLQRRTRQGHPVVYDWIETHYWHFKAQQWLKGKTAFVIQETKSFPSLRVQLKLYHDSEFDVVFLSQS